MIEPTLALQTAIRAALIAAPAVIALVPADHIRSGSTRPDNLPSIIMSGGQTIFLGNGSGSQYLARVFLDLHIWAVEDGADTAQAIGFAVSNILKEAPDAAGFSFDDFGLPAIRWMRDPEPEKSFTHGVLTVEAVMRWSI
ncbi:DUF3168 domain-containing protein [Mesorhizobium sp. B2-2-4]|uniref:DUF3168 domain-containing protein n=1 Tax=unclassified Mesorhizobium TaxID=325217 RepID=UPI0011299E93|nr:MULTISPECIES: DUF3168 domain-containing protein [unclassified Mesorhizobium]TPM61103.1 DUF3168 domain-containing protein [Mesorhizobium sp. B2-2-4]TPM70535.1 DUF3168 domain-containing protein [Mesorhizobium sp. B2-2-1]TPN70387.1 DUF3168 domain-containing protein [Mesorhizobium sp. B1-1-3]